MSKRQRLLLSGHRKTAALKPTHSVATAAGRRLGRRRDSPPRCAHPSPSQCPTQPGGGGEGAREGAAAHEARPPPPGRPRPRHSAPRGRGGGGARDRARARLRTKPEPSLPDPRMRASASASSARRASVACAASPALAPGPPAASAGQTQGGARGRARSAWRQAGGEGARGTLQGQSARAWLARAPHRRPGPGRARVSSCRSSLFPCPP